MVLFGTGGGCVMAGEVTALLCLLVSLLPVRKGLRLPAPAVEVERDDVETGMVTLLLAGAGTLLAKKSGFGVCWEAAESGFEASVSADGVGSSGIVGIGCGAR
jgi:hypothetical protein